MVKRGLIALIFLAAAGQAAGVGIVDPVVEGNRLTATVSLAGGYEAELTVEFENAVGLTPANLGLSAELIDVNDSDLLARLPDSSVSPVAGFPVRISIEPPSDGGFSFAGIAKIGLYTHNLHYDPAVPLRMFSAQIGGEFRDVTETVSSGSYRTGASKGQFSEFLILLDARSNDAVAQSKFQYLNGLMSEFQSAMSASLHTQLQGHLDDAEAAYQAGLYSEAIKNVEAFASAVETAAAEGRIPNVWRSARDIDNVAGELRAGARTLRFTLTLLANQL